MTEDDPFRKCGSRFESEEVVALARCSPSAPVDWVSLFPEHVLWVPESLFASLVELAPGTLGRLNIYRPNRLRADEIASLLSELSYEGSGDEGECVAAARALAEDCLSRGDELLVEGP